MVCTLISQIKGQVDPFMIPPSIDALVEYRRATQAGYIGDVSLGRETFSLLYRDNNKFGLLDSIDKFSQMGPGYTLLFTFTKLAILMGLFPVVIYGFFMMSVYMSGNTCLELDQLLKVQA